MTGATGQSGTNGTNGLNALIKTTTEPAGANCTNGGTKIETGLDANSNGVLENSEVNATQTQYVCNGFNGSSGSSTYNGSSIISNDTVSPLMRYIGNGQEGAFNCSTFSGTLSGEHYYTNFKVPYNCTLMIQPSNTTIIHVKDTCIINGTINGNGNIVPTFQETRDFLGATGDYSGSACGGQSGYYYKFSWSYSPEGLSQLLGLGHQKTTGERWHNVSMTLNDMRIASFLGVKIHGCSSNMFNCNYTSQGGAGLIIICKVLVFNGQISLNGTNGPTGCSGGGSLIISSDNVITNSGTVSQSGVFIPPLVTSSSGSGYYYLIHY